MSNSTRSKGKISSVSNKSVSLNTLVSTSKQGNNSMADVQDAEDSNGEAEGSDIITYIFKIWLRYELRHAHLIFQERQ